MLNKSPYVDHANLIDTLKQKTDIFKCLSLNIQSLNAKIEQLRIQLRIDNCKFGAICVQETWLAGGRCDSPLQIEGYTLINQLCSLTSHSG